MTIIRMDRVVLKRLVADSGRRGGAVEARAAIVRAKCTGTANAQVQGGAY